MTYAPHHATLEGQCRTKGKLAKRRPEGRLSRGVWKDSKRDLGGGADGRKLVACEATE